MSNKTISPLVAVVDIETASTQVDAVIATIAQLYTRLAHENDTVKQHLAMIDELREGLQTLYANHGEDENVAAICNPLIEKSRLVI